MSVKPGEVLLGKYTVRQRIGGSDPNNIYMVEDEYKQPSALRVVDKKKILGENGHLAEYLQSEATLLNLLKGPHVLKQTPISENQAFVYFLSEYCNGGTLTQVQRNLPGGVFTLDEAKKCLKQVIEGIIEIHQHGYIHRDIKLSHVLASIEHGKTVYKLTGFGYAKKNGIRSTVLGCDPFTGPQVFKAGFNDQPGGQQSHYGFEADMWSFGVLMFLMLNKTFPFKMNPEQDVECSIEEKCQRKFDHLKQKSHQFSYSQAVMKTSKPNAANCTPEMEDLFKRIFEVDASQRITFTELKRHPVFCNLFEEGNDFRRGRIGSAPSSPRGPSMLRRHSNVEGTSHTLPAIPSVFSTTQRHSSAFETEGKVVRLEMEEVDFLQSIIRENEAIENTIGSIPCLALAYNIQKYQVILYKKLFLQQQPTIYASKYPNTRYRWAEFFNSDQYRTLRKDQETKLMRSTMQLQIYYALCSEQREKISKINPQFFECFWPSPIEEQLSGKFLASYTLSANYVYNSLKKLVEDNQNKNRLYLCLTLTLIGHVFSQIRKSQHLKNKVFENYLVQFSKPTLISYKHFHSWLQDQEQEELRIIISRIAHNIFG